MIKHSLWITLLCCVPYFVFFGLRETHIPGFALLGMALFLVLVLLYYVLFKATELPKK
ncbi:MAG: hypothetical protein JNJ88_21030 [Planctomycetes bacterium]|nr:hypothetical protein [Planctomycetota bacterium]